MPLTAFVQSQLDRIRSFLADPDAVLLELRCAGEQQALVGKLLVGLSQEGDDLWAAVDAPFEQADAWVAEIAAAIDAALQDAGKELEAAGVVHRPPPPLEDAGVWPRRSAEARLVEYAERVGACLVPFLRGLVIAIRITDTPELRAKLLPLAQSLGRIVEACEGGRVHVILLTTPELPIVKPVPVPRPRTTVWAPGDRADIGDLRRVAIETAPRMLAYDAPRRGQQWLPPALIEAGLANGYAIVKVDDVRFWRPIHFYAHASRIAVEACAAIAERLKSPERIDPFRAEVASPVGREDAELPFAQLLDRLQREVLPPECGLLVVLAPALEEPNPGPEMGPELAAFARSLETLARNLASSRVKVYGVAPGVGALARPREREALAVHTMRLDAPVIEKGLLDKLAEPELPKIVRMRCLAALSSLRMGNGDPESAMELQLQTLQLAHETEDPIEIAAAWHGMGHTLYRCGALDKASEAYARCTDIAVTHDHATLAAHGMTGLAHCEFVVGHCDTAIEYYRVAAKYHRNMGNPVAEAYVLTWIAESHAKAGRKPEAVVQFDEALARCDECHETMADAADSMRADILQRKGRVYGNAGITAEKKRFVDMAQKLGATAPPSEEP
ncbi:MAG: hypothetical protein K1X88_34940 [Nannocystaceae bacterium]|nr:hypothetical protein [Nannocystaceae bacterium]